MAMSVLMIKPQEKTTMDIEDRGLIQRCCNTVQEQAPDRHAKAYAEACNVLIRMAAPDSQIKMQILYILTNLASWRGEKAREIKLILKGFTS